MKLILLVPLSGTDGSKTVGEPIEVHEEGVLKYLEKGIAKFETKKKHDAFISEMKKTNDAKKAKQAEAKAIFERDQIEAELNGLYEEVVLKEAELNGVVLDGEQILEMVEELKKRILPITKSDDGVAGDGAE